jgi:hypothetical protein
MRSTELGDISLERMVRAVEKVRDRLLRATTALETSGVPYAVTGGNAVAAWVARVDEAAVRNTPDIDILVRRDDFKGVQIALLGAGFTYRSDLATPLFVDGPYHKVRDAVDILFAGEKVRPEYAYPTTDVEPCDRGAGFRVVALESLVQMKLTSFRDKDRMHLRDLLDVGLVDESWLARLPADLAARLKELIDSPDG